MKSSRDLFRPSFFLSFKLVTASFFLFFVLGAGLWQMSRLDSEDIDNYHEIISIFDSSAQPQLTAYQANQDKVQLQKDIVFTHKEQPLHLKLCAKSSRLIYERYHDRNEVVEKMNGVTCLMQEELYYIMPDGREVVIREGGKLRLRHADPSDAASWISPDTPDLLPMQMLRYLEADKAVYHYKDDLFAAEEVSFFRYTAPGHQIVDGLTHDRLLMEGIADKIEFSLSSHLNFKAHGLQAAFFKESAKGSSE